MNRKRLGRFSASWSFGDRYTLTDNGIACQVKFGMGHRGGAENLELQKFADVLEAHKDDRHEDPFDTVSVSTALIVAFNMLWDWCRTC